MWKYLSYLDFILSVKKLDINDVSIRNSVYDSGPFPYGSFI